MPAMQSYPEVYKIMDFNSFIYSARRTVYKWWCVVYKPVYKLTHQGYWPNEKEPYMVFPDKSTQNEQTENQTDVETASSDSEIPTANDDFHTAKTEDFNEAPLSDHEQEIIANADDDALRRANEIMERLAREASADDEKKQNEIRRAREQAAEQEMLANIMNANKVDIESFIEEGKNKRDET